MQYLVRILDGRTSHLEDAGLGEGLLQDSQHSVLRNTEAPSPNYFCSGKAISVK